jgi:hypothetical protein
VLDAPGVVGFDVWAGWVERACRINEYAAPDRNGASGRAKPRADGPPADDSPGTDFNRRGSWDETGLFEGGWAWARRDGGEDRGLICRPDKDGGVSASVGMVTSKENGWPLFWCWSTSVPNFVAEQPYTRFAVFAVLRHGGDYSAAAKDLAARGYGRHQPEPPPPTFGEFGKSAGPDGGPERFFKWMSELRFREANDKWLLDGFVSRGGVTLLSALWKAGKSTLLSHMIRAFDGRASEFIGRAITPGRVLYVSEEHEELWAERRDDLGIGDHVGMVHRPFKGRPSPAEWATFLGKVVESVAEFRFDVVIFDTISKLWPVRDENDAGQVEDALMPLWNVTNLGAALVLVHHNRKSDGKEFTGMRGSGGLPAFCETIIEFRRNTDDASDCKRVLTSAGRYRETPAKLLIEKTPAGYVSHGNPDDPLVAATFGDNAWKEETLAVIPVGGQGATLAELQKVAKVREAVLKAWLDERTRDGELNQIGKGSKGSPIRWSKPTFSSAPCDVSGEENREENVIPSE